MQKDINIKLKVEGIVNKDDVEIKVIIKEGVQAALKKLEEYQALGYPLFLNIYYL